MAVKQKWKYLVEDGEKINQSMEIDQFEMQVIVPCLGLIPQFHPVEGEVNSQSHIESYSSPCRFKFDPLGMFKVQIEATRKHGGRQGERAYFYFVKGVTS